MHRFVAAERVSSARIVREAATVDNSACDDADREGSLARRHTACTGTDNCHASAMNITDPLRRCAQLHPGRAAVARLNRTTASYGELDRTVDAIARRMLEAGLRPGDTVMIAFRPPYMYLALALASARIGVATATVKHPPAACAACLAPEGVAGLEGVRTIPVGADWFLAPPPTESLPPVPSHQDAAAVCGYFESSGTTGVPKRIGISHALMAKRIAAKERFAPLPGEPRQIFAVGPYAAYGFRDTLRVLGQGGLVVFVSSIDDTLAFIPRHEVNYLVVAPALLQRLVAARPPDADPFPSLSLIEVGGSHLPRAVWQGARARLCPHVLSTYGATESGSVAAAPMEDLLDHPDAVGRVFAGVEVQAVDAEDRPLPAGTEGILRIRSELCVDRYDDDPVASAQVFRDGWFYPGDLGVVSADGRLDVTGRVDEVINNGGNKISPHVIEDVLLAQAGIVDAAAFGMPDAEGVMRIGAAVVARPAVDMDVVMRECREKLGGSAPNFILNLAALPRNAGGKVVRAELVKTAAANAQLA